MANLTNFHIFPWVPGEVQTLIWEHSALLHEPTIHFLEVDFKQVLPYLQLAGPQAGGQYNHRRSAYHKRAIIVRAGRQARVDLKRTQPRLLDSRLTVLKDLQDEERYKNHGPIMDVWMKRNRDLVCFQGPRHRMAWQHPAPWFHTTEPRYYPQHAVFRPLKEFGFHKLQRTGIDWDTEVARTSMGSGCDGQCALLCAAYFYEVNDFEPTRRTYCSDCMRLLVAHWNDIPRTTAGLVTYIRTFFPVDPLQLRPDMWAQNDYLTFRCRACDRHIQVPRVFGYYDELKPAPCQPWHNPRIKTDILTLLMGRMPALKIFYVVDSSVKLKPNRSFSPRFPYESFAGNDCSYVEVNPEDDAWDLTGHQTAFRPDYPYGFNSMELARKVQLTAWRASGRLLAYKLFVAKERLENPDFVLDNWELQLEETVTQGGDDEGWQGVEGPYLPPQHLMPVQCKVLTRIDN